MTIIVNNKEIEQLEQFSDKTQTLIQFLNQGAHSTDALIQQSEVMTFTSEAQFIEQLYLGLMNSTLLYLHQIPLSVDIKKLLELSTNDLRDLATFSNRDSETDKARLANILAKYRLVDSAILNKIALFYRRYNLNYHALGWGASFHDQLTLYSIICYCEQAYDLSNQTVHPACQWATEKAQNLSEFARYFCLYLAWKNAKQGGQGTPDHLVEILAPVVNNTLDSPVVTFELQAVDLHNAIKQWHEGGNNLGFSSFSAGLLNIVLNIDLQSDDLVKAANDYISGLQTTLTNALASDSYICQAGLCRHYLFNLHHSEALLNVDGQGCLSLFNHWPIAA
ncbi:hypothetical protein [Pseudoalteromonas luteoviolacea]|uniref:Uncharacterized protein n=1 Tax=Pseudoalteromonas luteoviolacea H33 TaxID=1365251 RepID=A0A167F4V2_9GAMM|nr:hypothetical protein [Pseudoalteromonas luteoviolacea]KZN51643.1 hypothetical protein N476_12510 [Pseudoalteromonas luteoviolacea H33]KZN79100.1 hypothetical protein N477_06260 [Pseudoalteromonas luteoviolacea H33-S]MBQ4878224.1 hypothetical protein [Pseudoalteromonas luteoviolacea]MBQ4907379.1 hypothetical protein [Pseudoalteromonas luteoviolacea]